MSAEAVKYTHSIRQAVYSSATNHTYY